MDVALENMNRSINLLSFFFSMSQKRKKKAEEAPLLFFQEII